jgi:hypothetical protein
VRDDERRVRVAHVQTGSNCGIARFRPDETGMALRYRPISASLPFGTHPPTWSPLTCYVQRRPIRVRLAAVTAESATGWVVCELSSQQGAIAEPSRRTQ